MANESLEHYKSWIINIYKEGCQEEGIVEQLCEKGVETTFSEVLQHLELWNAIPCPSPAHSKDADNPAESPPPDPYARLGVTCHHGESSHSSSTSVAVFPSDVSSTEKYKKDFQTHEDFAYYYRQQQITPAVAAPSPIEADTETDSNYEAAEMSTDMINIVRAKCSGNQNKGSKKRCLRDIVVRKDRARKRNYLKARINIEGDETVS